jgi:hypothetical protein
MSSVRFGARLDTSHHGPPQRHPQCDGEMSLRCQEEPHTQGCSGVPTGKNPEDSSQASVEVMQWVLLYLSFGHDRTPRTARLKCAGAPSRMYHFRALTASGTSALAHVCVYARDVLSNTCHEVGIQ